MSVDKIVNEITQQLANDGSANYIQLIQQIKTIGDVTQIILGLLVAVICIGFPIVIVIEVCYINFPILQHSMENVAIRTKGKMNKAVGLVLRDARKAVLIAQTTNTERSTNLIYLKIKYKSIFIAFLIVGLIIGVGPLLVQLIMKLAKSLLIGFGI